MLEHAKTLSSGCPKVRIDVSEINDEPVLRELTFTMEYDFGQKNLAKKRQELDLSQIKKRKIANCIVWYKL